MQKIIKKVRQELKKGSDEKTRNSAQRFFKEKVKFYGVKTALVGKIAKETFKEVKDLDKKEIWALCEELWQSGFMEEAFIACQWSYFIRKKYQPADFLVFEKWINKYVSNWATCDTFCNHTVGDLVEKYPKFLANLKKWTKSSNRWVRRASAVTLIVPARHGKFLKEVMEISDRLLLDKEDLVQKGYGWALKAASEKHSQEVLDYVIKNKKQMPRTALRYAIEKMPQDWKKKAMEK